MATFKTRLKGVEDWEECWEYILRLPIEPFANAHLYEAAEWLVRTCRAYAGFDGIDWFAWEVEDGQSFVAEQLANDPDNAVWQRIAAVLAGAQAGLIDEP